MFVARKRAQYYAPPCMTIHSRTTTNDSSPYLPAHTSLEPFSLAWKLMDNFELFFSKA